MKSGVVLFVMVLAGSAWADDPKPPPPDAQFVEFNEWFFMTPNADGSVPHSDRVLLGKRHHDSERCKGCQDFIVAGRVDDEPGIGWFQTRLAKPEDLVAGRRVVYPRVPIKKKEDKPDTWVYRMVVDVVDAPPGKVIVAGASDVEVDRAGLRVIVDDKAPALAMTGKEDAQHFHPEHWLVYVGDGTPDPDGCEARMAIAIKAPAKKGAEGTFMRTDNGELITTKYAWHSHAATKAELVDGARIAAFSEGGDVPDRRSAYSFEWDINKIKIVDGVARIGNSSARLDVLRILD